MCGLDTDTEDAEVRRACARCRPRCSAECATKASVSKNTGAGTLYGVSFPAANRGFAVGVTGAVYMFMTPDCAGGVLGLTSFSTISFPAVSLAGPLTSTAAGSLTVDDQTGSGSGWSVSATSTLFTRAGGQTLPANATTLQFYAVDGALLR